jgi:Fe-S-cluster containining protein
LEKTCSFDVCCQCKHSCCQDAKPPLTLKRKKIIADYLGKHEIQIAHPFVDEAYSFPAMDALGLCVFYCSGTKKCLVHPVKPETCIAGPITFDINPDTRKVKWYLKTAAICALAQALRGNDAAFRAHFDVAKDELLRLVRELDSRALQAILKIEEPQTVKIGEDDLPNEAYGKLGLEQRSKKVATC